MFEEIEDYVSEEFYNKLLALPKKKKYLLCDKRFKNDGIYSFMSVKNVVEQAITELKEETGDIQREWFVSDNEYEIICNIENEVYHNEVEIYELQFNQVISDEIDVWTTLDGETFVIIDDNYIRQVIKLNPMLDAQECFESEVMNSSFFTQKEKELIINRMREDY